MERDGEGQWRSQFLSRTVETVSRAFTVPLSLLFLWLEGRSLGDAWYILQPTKAPDRFDALLDPSITISPPYVSHLSRSNHTSRYLFAVQLFESAGSWDGPFRHLDVACGNGYASELLAPIDRSGTYTGVDISRRALRYASKYYSRRGRYVQANGTHLPFADDSFDSVTCIETLEHVPDDEALLSELRRVLARGGSLFLTTPHDESLDESESTKEYPHVNTYTCEELVALLDAVFEDATIEVYGQNTGLREYGPVDKRVDQLQPYGFHEIRCGSVPDETDYLIAHVATV